MTKFTEGFKEGSKGTLSELYPTFDLKKGSKFRERIWGDLKFWVIVTVALFAYIIYTGVRRGW